MKIAPLIANIFQIHVPYFLSYQTVPPQHCFSPRPFQQRATYLPQPCARKSTFGSFLPIPFHTTAKTEVGKMDRQLKMPNELPPCGTRGLNRNSDPSAALVPFGGKLKQALHSVELLAGCPPCLKAGSGPSLGCFCQLPI